MTCRGGNICGEKMVVSTAEFFYALGYWFAIPSRLAVVAKLERYEADTAVSDSEMIYTVGGAYYITPKTRIMLNYAHFSYEKSVSVNELWAMSQIGF